MFGTMSSVTVLQSLLALIALLSIGAYITNPFNKLTIIRRPFVAKLVDNVVHTIDNNSKLVISQSVFHRSFAVLKNGIHILSSRWVRSPRSNSTTLEEIINDIHALRFNPDKLLLTSGDHFSALFVRNLGVFYYPTLDRSIPNTTKQWHDREITYLQTVAYALGVFAKHDTLTTTIVPTGRYRATCVNFYAYPSDTLYGMLYALAALKGSESAKPVEYGRNRHMLDTKEATNLLIKTYGDSLTAHYLRYKEKAYDEKAGLVRKDFHMSGAKDITRRESSFYDNVVFWKTTQLAMTLGLIPADQPFLDTLKKTILKTFWLKKQGYFLEDLSEEGKSNKYYSSDWLIVLATGFLSPNRKAERHYFTESVNYIRNNGIAQPLPIKYQHDTRAHRQFLAVRLAVASYGGDAIWSFWGMEYIKVLLILHKVTNSGEYLQEADQHITSYKATMLRDGGFPEVYSPDGKLLQTPLYRSVRQTGWVIGFEQVLALRKTIKLK